MKYASKLETQDLILAKAKPDDLKSIFQNYWSSEKTAKYMLWSPQKDLQQAQKMLGSAMDYQKEHLYFFVYEKQTGQAIGHAGMVETEPGVFEDTGIGVGENFVGKGYGKQILNCLINYVFGKLNAKKIICSCHTDNVASAKLQLSCGLKYDHSKMHTRKKDGLTYKADYYSITKDGWLKNSN